jgi:hypothetical protein
MGLSQTGGGGSVYWRILANEVDDDGVHHKKGPGKRKTCHQEGCDQDGAVGTDFIVSIKVPGTFSSAQDFLNGLHWGVDEKEGRVSFALPIEANRNQIQISWGSKSSA